jgi:hypothetical protein
MCCQNICAVELAIADRPSNQLLCDERINRTGIHLNNGSLHAKFPFTNTVKNYLNVEQCGLYTHKFISNIQLRTFKERQFNNYKRQEKLSKNTVLETSNPAREKRHKPQWTRNYVLNIYKHNAALTLLNTVFQTLQ